MDRCGGNPAVSVIMPVYNTAQYLAEAVESVLRQGLKDWELILVDDGSTDGSGVLCDKWAAMDDRIRVIHTENQGLSCARNTGMKMAQGAYLQFLDSDDWLSSNALETAAQTAAKEDADMVLFDLQYEWQERSWHEQSVLAPGIYNAETVLESLATPAIPPNALNKFCRRELYAGITFPAGEKWEDVATTFYPVARAKRIVVLDAALYHYRQRPDSITKQALKDQSIYFWRYHQYAKRFEALREKHPNAAKAARSSIVKNGIYCAAFCLRGPENRKARRQVRRYLANPVFCGGLPWKVSAARLGFLIFPTLTSALLRRRKRREAE